MRFLTLAWLFSCKFAAYFQNTFPLEHLWVAASEMRRISIALTIPGNNHLQKNLFNITLKFSTVHGSGKVIIKRNGNSYLFAVIYLVGGSRYINFNHTTIHQTNLHLQKFLFETYTLSISIVYCTYTFPLKSINKYTANTFSSPKFKKL